MHNMGKYKVAIVIPAYNEELTISQVVYSVKGHGCVIVINDASTDRTKKIAEDAGAIVINHKQNEGYDSALRSGFKKAFDIGVDAVITFDADGQHSSEMLKEYIKYLKNGKDLVLGIRPNPARISEWLFMVYTRIRFNWKDPLCGMKGYSMNLYKKQGFFDSYNSINTELAIFGLLHEFSYIQIPIPIIKRQDNPRFSSTIRSNFYIVLALIKTIKNRKG